MAYVDALYELKRSQRKCNEANNELEDFKRLLNDKDDRDSRYQEFLSFIWGNAERESDDKRKRDDYDEENDPTHKDQPVERNKRLEIKIKVEGRKAGTSNPVPEKPRGRAQLGVKGKTHSQKKSADDYDEENDPTHEDQLVERNKRLEIKIKAEGRKAGTSNPVPEKPRGRAQLGVKGKTHSQKKSADDYDEENDPTDEDQPVERNKRLEIKIKVEGRKAGTSNPVPEKPRGRAQLGVKGKTHSQKKSADVIRIDDEDSKRYQRSESGGSNSVSEKMYERSRPAQQDLKAKIKKPKKFKGVKEDQPVEKNKTLEIQIKVEGSKAGTSNPVSKLGVEAKTHQKMKFVRVTQIDDGDEDSNISSDQPRPKDKGESVISENPEVEILDDSAFLKQGIVSPFVPSKRYHKSLLDDDAENAVFRSDVLKVLRKPFDMEEYDRLKEAIKAGSYLDHHEDLIEVLQSQSKPEKRLAILRGFFFWLQNLTRKGAFRPWNDRVCLEVVPARPWNDRVCLEVVPAHVDEN